MSTIDGPESNFTFLAEEWPDLFESALKAERLAIAHPEAACVMAGRSLEDLAWWLYALNRNLVYPNKENSTLAGLISEVRFKAIVPKPILRMMFRIKEFRNTEAHSNRNTIDKDQGRVAVQELFYIFQWFAGRYSSQGQSVYNGLKFDSTRLPREEYLHPLNSAELESLRDEIIGDKKTIQSQRVALQQAANHIVELRSQVVEQTRENHKLNENLISQVEEATLANIIEFEDHWKSLTSTQIEALRSEIAQTLKGQEAALKQATEDITKLKAQETQKVEHNTSVPPKVAEKGTEASVSASVAEQIRRAKADEQARAQRLEEQLKKAREEAQAKAERMEAQIRKAREEDQARLARMEEQMQKARMEDQSRREREQAERGTGSGNSWQPAPSSNQGCSVILLTIVLVVFVFTVL